MKIAPKAPPVYKPSAPTITAPPVYKPVQADNRGVQLKPANHFRTETRPAPPAYRPQQTANPTLQTKTAGNFRLETRPAPPVYRPQDGANLTLQSKAHGFQQGARTASPAYRMDDGANQIAQSRTSCFRQHALSTPPVHGPQFVGCPARAAAPAVAPRPVSTIPHPVGMFTVQRYTLVRDGHFSGKKSQNGLYVTGENLSEIYVLPGANVERSYRTTEIATILKVDYEVWKPSLLVIEDCVAAMEEIMHGKKLKYGAPEVSEFRDLSSSGSSKKRKITFGDSDKRSRELGKKTDLGEGADPGLLEGYVIARQGYKRDEELPQFHGAAVVAQDGQDDITLEATAPESGPSSRHRVAPVYDMYSRNKKHKKSFKHRYKAHYGSDASVSVVKAVTPLDPKVLAPQVSKMVVEFV